MDTVADRVKPGSLYAKYDGRLRLYWPDDLYLLGSAQALVALRRAIDKALRTGMGACTGLYSDDPAVQTIVMLVKPDDALLSDVLRDKPTEIPVTLNDLPTLFNRGDE